MVPILSTPAGDDLHSGRRGRNTSTPKGANAYRRFTRRACLVCSASNMALLDVEERVFLLYRRLRHGLLCVDFGSLRVVEIQKSSLDSGSGSTNNSKARRSLLPTYLPTHTYLHLPVPTYLHTLTYAHLPTHTYQHTPTNILFPLKFFQNVDNV